MDMDLEKLEEKVLGDNLVWRTEEGVRYLYRVDDPSSPNAAVFLLEEGCWAFNTTRMGAFGFTSLEDAKVGLIILAHHYQEALKDIESLFGVIGRREDEDYERKRDLLSRQGWRLGI